MILSRHETITQSSHSAGCLAHFQLTRNERGGDVELYPTAAEEISAHVSASELIQPEAQS